MPNESRQQTMPDPDASSESLPQASPDRPSPSAETIDVPKSVMPDQKAAAPSDSPQFVGRQESSDWLASELIGKVVLNANNKAIGDVNDIVYDKDGKAIAVLIGVGGFLGLGEKDVALRFEDLLVSRDDRNEVIVLANVSEDTLASAPDFETLNEQTLKVGAREGAEEQPEEQQETR
jgi:sporulation protein YlmC with PRC-barrel domain